MSDSDVSMEEATVFRKMKPSLAPKPEKLIPWIEKYRPATVDEITHQDEVVRALKSCIEKANIPHLLFYGPAGTGKTSCVLAAAKQLFGPELYKQRVLELNASDERGINVVREKVKKFAQYAVGTQKSGDYPCPPFKIVILDEADSMTKDAQAALRRTMETYTKVTRFCIICNYVSRIIEPVTSRCAKFRFQSIGADAHATRLRFIADKEGFDISNQALGELVQVADGDLRRSISLLQSARLLCNENEALTPDHIREIACSIPDDFVRRALQVCVSGNFQVAREFSADLKAQGFAVNQFVAQLSDAIIDEESLTDVQKAKAARVLALVDERLNDGSDEQLQTLFAVTQLREICQA